MNSMPSRRTMTWSGAVCAVLLSLVSFAVASGCGKSEAAPKPSATERESIAPSAGPKAEADNYVAEIKSTGPYKAGEQGTVTVTLNVKGDFHTNPQYPYKFKTTDPAPDGVTFPKPIMKREDGTFETKRAEFKVPFVVAKAGSATIGGTLYLSVCSDANCVMDKVPLEIPVDVK